jgi:hypothetical protein
MLPVFPPTEAEAPADYECWQSERPSQWLAQIIHSGVLDLRECRIMSARAECLAQSSEAATSYPLEIRALRKSAF